MMQSCSKPGCKMGGGVGVMLVLVFLYLNIWTAVHWAMAGTGSLQNNVEHAFRVKFHCYVAIVFSLEPSIRAVFGVPASFQLSSFEA